MRVVFVRASPGNRRQCTRHARTLGVILTAAVSAVQDADFGDATLGLQIHSPPWIHHHIYWSRKETHITPEVCRLNIKPDHYESTEIHVLVHNVYILF